MNELLIPITHVQSGFFQHSLLSICPSFTRSSLIFSHPSFTTLFCAAALCLLCSSYISPHLFVGLCWWWPLLKAVLSDMSHMGCYWCPFIIHYRWVPVSMLSGHNLHGMHICVVHFLLSTSCLLGASTQLQDREYRFSPKWVFLYNCALFYFVQHI